MISEKLVDIKNEVDTQEDIINSIAFALNGKSVPGGLELLSSVIIEQADTISADLSLPKQVSSFTVTIRQTENTPIYVNSGTTTGNASMTDAIINGETLTIFPQSITGNTLTSETKGGRWIGGISYCTILGGRIWCNTCAPTNIGNGYTTGSLTTGANIGVDGIDSLVIKPRNSNIVFGIGTKIEVWG